VTEPPARLAAALADRYRIERELGAGGMATVYLAQDLKHDRKVAIKVLRPELAAALGHDRFLREITTTAGLRHPHILPLYDSGEAGGFLYYAMPFVEGESLRDRLTRDKQLPVADALQIAREVADALSYAHGRGVVHRDIKPENILLESGHAVVADFGIARAVSVAGQSSLTQVGMAIGTPAYMSPEQAAGEQSLDGRSDLYALGCVTYEMLAGQPPFSGPTVESIIHQHIAATPPPVTQIRTAVPDAVAGAVQRALAKNPVDRFASLSEFSAALHADTRSGNVQAPRRRAFGVFAAVGVVAVLVFAWLGFRGARAGETLDPDVIAVLPFRVGGDPAISYLRESMLDLLQARLSGGLGARTVEPRTLLAAWRRTVKNESEDLSEEASRELATELGAGRVLLGSAIATPTELTLSGSLMRVGDGEMLARETVSGAPDSIAVLVNQLTAALLIREAGEAGERSAGLASAPLDALQGYLAGRKAYRRGDYFGAMGLYGRAFARDSTFVEAAFNMVATNAWIGTIFTTAGYDVVPRVWRMRDRLGARDLALFLALPMVGPNYPRPSSYREIIAQAERAANLAPDNPEPWLLLGQLLSQYGEVSTQAGWAGRAADALDRAIGLDSSFTKAVETRLYVAAQSDNTPAIARYVSLFERHVASGFSDTFILWAAARALGDSAAAAEWRARVAAESRMDQYQAWIRIALHSAQHALPLGDARWAVAGLKREATTDTERVGAVVAGAAVSFAEGRSDPGDVHAAEAIGPGWAATLIQQGLVEPAYLDLATRTIAAEAAGAYRLSTAAGPVRWAPIQDCYATLYRLTAGDTAGTGESIRRLRAFPLADDGLIGTVSKQPLESRVCILLLEALVEDRLPPGPARPSLDRLDSLMHDGPPWYGGPAGLAPVVLANYTVARLREARGELPAALAAIRRREVNYFPPYLWSLPAFLRQEGRLAALTGDTVGAIRAYDAYLALRTDPDPPLTPQRDSVVAERAVLARSTTR
jgi:tRNA A-37 threonylcarbamoyl transferase component Bud32/tetratricopeptide (TPR) repeat protein